MLGGEAGYLHHTSNISNLELRDNTIQFVYALGLYRLQPSNITMENNRMVSHCPVELPTNLREVAQCPERAPSRTFSLLKGAYGQLWAL